MVRKGGHLRRMGDAQHLMPFCRLVQQLPDAPRCQAGNAGVDLVIDHGRQGVAVCQRAFECQHNAGKLAARGNFGQRFGGLPGVGRNQKFHLILPMGAERTALVLERKLDARHVQKFQRCFHFTVHRFKCLQTALGQGFRPGACLGVKRLHLLFQFGALLIGGLVALQFVGSFFTPRQNLLDFQPEPLFDAPDHIQAALDLIQLSGIKSVHVQAVSKIRGELPCVVVQLVQSFRERRKAFVQTCAFAQCADGSTQQVGGSGLLVVLLAGKCAMCGGNAIQNGLRMGDDGAAFLQRLFFAGPQGGNVDRIQLLAQRFDAALLFCLAGVQGIQLALYGNDLPVLLIISAIQRLILRILIQKAQVHGGVGQAGAVVLAVDGKQPGRDLPQHRSGSRHAVDAKIALAFGVDLAVEQQLVSASITALFQLLLHLLRHVSKGGPHAGFGGTAAHQIAGGAVAQNCVDGINEDGFACAGLAGQHVKAGGKAHLGFFNDSYVFDLQCCKHGISSRTCRNLGSSCV